MIKKQTDTADKGIADPVKDLLYVFRVYVLRRQTFPNMKSIHQVPGCL